MIPEKLKEGIKEYNKIINERNKEIEKKTEMRFDIGQTINKLREGLRNDLRVILKKKLKKRGFKFGHQRTEKGSRVDTVGNEDTKWEKHNNLSGYEKGTLIICEYRHSNWVFPNVISWNRWVVNDLVSELDDPEFEKDIKNIMAYLEEMKNINKDVNEKLYEKKYEEELESECLNKKRHDNLEIQIYKKKRLNVTTLSKKYLIDDNLFNECLNIIEEGKKKIENGKKRTKEVIKKINKTMDKYQKHLIMERI